MRVVRVGTHAINKGEDSTLWKRLRKHRGTLSGVYAGGGNHRRSAFRRHVGDALMKRDNWPSIIKNTWGVKKPANMCETRNAEYPYERKVSNYLENLLILWLGVEGVASYNMRSYLERNSIALLSHSDDIPGENWLGNYSSKEAIRKSGLWNVNHVDEAVDEEFIDVFAYHVKQM